MTASDILLWLGETSVAVSILIVLVLVLRKPFSQYFGARAAYALWLAPLMRLFLPELAILPPPEVMLAPIEWTYATASVASPAIATLEPASFNFTAFFAAAALLIWALVAIAWFSMKLETQSRFIKARLAASKAASPSVMEAARAAAANTAARKLPKIRICDDAYGPAVIGLFKPVLFLPAGFENDYSLKEQHLALAHELAHIARGDMFVQLAAFAFQAAQWPNPLVHFAMGAFRTDQEAACDAYVLALFEKDGGRAAGDYASAILKSACKGAAPAHGLSLGHPVKERLMLLKAKQSPLRLLAGAAAVAIVAAGGLAATASYGYAAESKTSVAAADKVHKIRKVKEVSTSNTVIELDDGETFDIKGVKNAAKIEVNEENGERTVRIYDKKGKLLSEKVYGPDDKSSLEEVVVVSKDGERQTIKLTPIAHRTHRMKLIGEKDGESDVLIEILGDEDINFTSKDGVHRVMSFSGDGGPGATFVGHCSSKDGEDGPALFEWRDEDGDKTEKVIKHEIICLDGDDATPEQRAEALRKVIAQMEEDAKRRDEMIAEMKKELRELEKK